MSETNEMRRALLDLSMIGSRVFRENVGQGVVGDVSWVRTKPVTVTLHPGDAYVRHARVLHAGLDTGCSDIIGLTPIEVTAALVGRTVPVFTSIEMKFGKGRRRPDQIDWGNFMTQHDAIYGVARSAAEAVEIVQAYRRGAK
ncbi:MAG TPA: hypothetical protein VJP88_08595 [Caulobacteraceae bacterium]|nr:hypothetical protein [Caulobacteraceae bacterium]